MPSSPVYGFPMIGIGTWQTKKDEIYNAFVLAVESTLGTSFQPLDADLSAYAALATTGLVARTGAGTVATRTLTGPAAGITVTNGDGVAGNPTLALANDLAALEGLGSTGLAARTAADTWAQRTITGTANKITVTNGDGVAGNPTLTIPDAVTLVTPTVTGLLTCTGGQIKFPATQAPSADANTLDDYEEGTWTPVLTCATPGNLSVTYSSQTGSYTKIGNVVALKMSISTSAFTHTTAAGELRISGVPFSLTGGPGIIDYSGITKAGYTTFNLAPSGSNLVGRAAGSGVTRAVLNITDLPTGGSIQLYLNAVFFV